MNVSCFSEEGKVFKWLKKAIKYSFLIVQSISRGRKKGANLALVRLRRTVDKLG